MSEPKKFLIYKLTNPDDSICEEIKSQESKEEIEVRRGRELVPRQLNTVDKLNLVTQNPRGTGDTGYLRLSRALIIGGGASVDGKLTINSTAASTSPDSGAFVVNGGLGVVGDVNIGGTGPATVFPDITELPASSVGDSNISELEWTSICWSPKLAIFCAVSLEGVIGRSSDGMDWREVQIPDRQFVNICWSDEQDLFCAITNDKYVFISTNAIQWTEYIVPSIQRIVILEDKYIKVISDTISLPGQINISKGLYSETELINYLNSQITQYITTNNLSQSLQQLTVSYENYLQINPIIFFPSNRIIFKARYYNSDTYSYSPITLKFYNSSNNSVDSLLPLTLGYTGTQININNQIMMSLNSYGVAGQNPPIIDTIQDMILSCITWSPGLNKFCILSKIVIYNTFPICAVFTSSNGVDWTRKEIAQSNWNSICWSPELNILCAVSTGQNCVIYSRDGIDWTVPSIPSYISINNWVSICWSSYKSKFCVVADNNTLNKCIMTSSDGKNWTKISSPVNNRTCIVWSSDLQIFCALGLNTKNSIISNDGVKWRIKYATGESYINQWSCITYSPELRKICGLTKNNKKTKIITDNYELTSASLIIDGGIGIKKNSIIFDDTNSENYTTGALLVKGGVGIGKNLNVGGTLEMGFLKVAADAPVTTDVPIGLIDKWVVYNAVVDNCEWNSIIWVNILNKFFAVGNNKIASSTDGLKWTNLTIPISDNWIGITYHNSSENLYVISSSKIINSYDGETWGVIPLEWAPIYISFTDIVSSDSVICIISEGNGYIYSSPDGVNWTTYLYVMPVGIGSKSWNSITYSQSLNKFCAISSNIQTFALSSDGIEWDIYTPSDYDMTIKQWESICWSEELKLFCAVGIKTDKISISSYIIISSDGINWNFANATLERDYVFWNESSLKFYALKNNSNIILSSNNGIDWVEEYIQNNEINLCKKVTYSSTLKLVCGIFVNSPKVLISNNNYEFLSGSIIKGGLGIGQNLVISADSESTDIFTGSLIVDGGIGIKKSLNIGNKLSITNASVGFPSTGIYGGNGAKIILSPGSDTSMPYALGRSNNSIWYSGPTGTTHVFYNNIETKDKLFVNKNETLTTSILYRELNIYNYIPTNLPNNISVVSIAYSSDLDKFAFVTNTTIYMSTDGFGTSWVNQNITGEWTSITSGIFPNYFFAVGKSTIATSYDGYSWVNRSLPTAIMYVPKNYYFKFSKIENNGLNSIYSIYKSMYTVNTIAVDDIFKSAVFSIDNNKIQVISPFKLIFDPVLQRCRFMGSFKLSGSAGILFTIEKSYNQYSLDIEVDSESSLYRILGFTSPSAYFTPTSNTITKSDSTNGTYYELNYIAPNSPSSTYVTIFQSISFSCVTTEKPYNGTISALSSINNNTSPYVKFFGLSNGNVTNDILVKNWNSICFSNNSSFALALYCAVSDGENCVALSYGSGWFYPTITNPIINTKTWLNVCWSSALQLFCAIANDAIMISQRNGRNWIYIPSPISGLVAVSSSEKTKQFIIITSSSTVLYSNDGLNWNSIIPTGTNSTNQWKSIAYNSQKELLVGISSNNSNILQIKEMPYTSINTAPLNVKGDVGIDGKLFVNSSEIMGLPTTGTIGGDGTRIILSKGDFSKTPYALGVNTNIMWYGVPSDASHVFYGGSNGTQELFKIQSNGNIVATGDITAFSDKRLKSDILTIEKPLDLIQNIRGVYYTNIHTNKKSIGVIAQEIEEIIPEVVSESSGYKSIAYGNMVALLIESIKDLQKKVNSLENEVNELKYNKK